MSFTGAFGTIMFLNPWILACLIFLPALWFLLRVTPPAPRLIRFPAARLLAGLIPREQTTSKTPWWILLLRLCVAALVIMALARPVLNPAATLPGDGPVRIVIDNGWAAAQTWRLQSGEAAKLVSRAGRAQREIYITTTAPEAGKDKPATYGPVTQARAEAILNGLTPLPWPAAYNAVEAAIKEESPRESITSFWLSTGLQDGDPSGLLRLLQAQGALHLDKPKPKQMPLLLRPAEDSGTDLKVAVSFAQGMPADTPFTVQALGKDGLVIDTQQARVLENKKTIDVTFKVPEAVREQIGRFRLAGRAGAGGLLLLDSDFQRRTIGIAAPAGQEDDAPLIGKSYYLHRALDPYADVQTGTIGELLKKKPAAIILPDVGALAPDDLNTLEKWVRTGGLLLRLAGPNMTQGEQFLTPAPLRKGGRAMDGALTWEKPVALAPFPQTSPYYGLEIPDDITVSRQILAEPVPGLENLTWAALQDGTPLITAKTLDRGLLVMIHTTATPQWSNLALSGLFVQILKRTVSLSGQSGVQNSQGGALQPLLVLDGFGNTQQPGATAEPIDAEKFDGEQLSSRHPPGIYGRAGYRRAFNAGGHVNAPVMFSAPGTGVEISGYSGDSEKELMPRVLLAAFCLFLADWLIVILMRTGLAWRAAATASMILLFAFPAHATTEEDMIRYAGNLYLAYVRSGVANVDATAQAGLQALSETLTSRTSVEPAGIVPVDPNIDDLVFFPFIYWPVAAGQQSLSPEGLRRVQDYIDHGGTILFDTRDKRSTPEGGNGANAEFLRTITGGIDIPPIMQMPKNHVLTKSFYLLRDFPGRYDGGTIWVEEGSLSGRDNVSSVIIGNHDWAAAWAAGGGQPRLSGGPEQQETALRFGVNVVMYALTGNYKSDQVHLPHILERLGQ